MNLEVDRGAVNSLRHVNSLLVAHPENKNKHSVNTCRQFDMVQGGFIKPCDVCQSHML